MIIAEQLLHADFVDGRNYDLHIFVNSILGFPRLGIPNRAKIVARLVQRKIARARGHKSLRYLGGVNAVNLNLPQAVVQRSVRVTAKCLQVQTVGRGRRRIWKRFGYQFAIARFVMRDYIAVFFNNALLALYCEF